MSTFLSIRATAKTGLIPEHRLRIMVKEGRCPGIYHGSKFMVNVPGLEELLRQKSLAAVRE